jgi:hypothetical protein
MLALAFQLLRAKIQPHFDRYIIAVWPPHFAERSYCPENLRRYCRGSGVSSDRGVVLISIGNPLNDRRAHRETIVAKDGKRIGKGIGQGDRQGHVWVRKPRNPGGL